MSELKHLLLTCLVLFSSFFGLETVLSSIKLNKNFLRRATGDERSSLFSCYTRKWKWNQSALLSTLFTLNGGQFSPKRNHTWSCRALSEEGAPLPRSRETEKSEVLNVSRDLESWRAILGKIKKCVHLALRGVAKIKFWLSLFQGKEQSCLFCWCLYWYVGAELSFTRPCGPALGQAGCPLTGGSTDHRGGPWSISRYSLAGHRFSSAEGPFQALLALPDFEVPLPSPGGQGSYWMSDSLQTSQHCLILDLRSTVASQWNSIPGTTSLPLNFWVFSGWRLVSCPVVLSQARQWAQITSASSLSLLIPIILLLCILLPSFI